MIRHHVDTLFCHSCVWRRRQIAHERAFACMGIITAITQPLLVMQSRTCRHRLGGWGFAEMHNFRKTHSQDTNSSDIKQSSTSYIPSFSPASLFIPSNDPMLSLYLCLISKEIRQIWIERLQQMDWSRYSLNCQLIDYLGAKITKEQGQSSHFIDCLKFHLPASK